jgi:subtilisin family serine protease
MEKEYIVVLRDTANYEEFWQEMENVTSGLEFIPDRAVAVINERTPFERICHYSLTDEEASVLKNDTRIHAVDFHPEQDPNTKIRHCAKRIGNYIKGISSTGDLKNWALLRCGSKRDVFQTTAVEDSFYGNVYLANTSVVEANVYNYILDGTGVDVVIVDSGIEWNHPEFKDDNGNSRVQRIDWYQTTGVSGTQNANHYRDYDGHGTHVAAIVAGRTFGWAKNANIYSIKLAGLEGAGDSGTGIGLSDHHDIIKKFHRNKPIDPVTGFKRPTIVNASWGFTGAFLTLSLIAYRGVGYTGSSINTDTVGRWAQFGIHNLSADGNNYVCNGYYASEDATVTDIVKEGVHYVSAAGNWYYKSTAYYDPDYNNYLVGTTNVGNPVTIFYHRGKSPQSNLAIMVGATDWIPHSSGLEMKASYSNGGTGVDVLAPGTGITSACSNTNIRGGERYNLNSGFKQTSIGGTSQASPQVCGLGALYLQMNPGAKPAELKKWLINNSQANTAVLYDSGSSSTQYTNLNALWGGPKVYMYNPFSIAQDGNVQNLTLENCVFTLN